MKNILMINDDTTGIIDRTIKAGLEYIDRHKNIKSFIIGISGGIDSAVTAALARQICDASSIQLFGYFINISGNKSDEIERGQKIGKQFCDKFQFRNMDETFWYIKSSFDDGKCDYPTHADKIANGNIKARLRMMYLYDHANRHNGLVLSTDNYTEYNLGFWTLHGDVGDLGLIQSLWKTEVYNMGKMLGAHCVECVEAVPTDGLGISHSDIEQLLPYWTTEMGSFVDAYRVVDDILIDYLTGQEKFGNNEKHPVIQRHLATKFKRRNPTNINRKDLVTV